MRPSRSVASSSAAARASDWEATAASASLPHALLRRLNAAQAIARMPNATESTIRHIDGSLPTTENTAPM